MKATVIYGQDHEGSTFNLTRKLVGKVGFEKVDEYFLPRDFSDFCIGCYSCFKKGKEHCPHHDHLKPIVESMISSDVIILASPTYCFSPSGQMKAFLDHLGYLWMSHRPEPSMFKKIGVSVSTCAGKGAVDTVKMLDEQMFFLGIPTRYELPITVAAERWEDISDDVRKKVERETDSIARKISSGKISVGPKMRGAFKIMKMNQERNEWNPIDKEHWVNNGWLDGKKPW